MKKVCLAIMAFLAINMVAQEMPSTSVSIDGRAGGKRFDGIGVVNGGGGTSALLKDYPEKQRNEILDLVYKPKFGASVSTLLVEVPGDGNSTQGSMPSHQHTRDDLNYHRGYTWWVMQEVQKRNPRLTLDGAAWSAPGWVGDGNFWSQDAADYYVNWLKGLRDEYGLKMTALGCRNEKGDSYSFAKTLRKTLNDNGFEYVKIHAFDNWYKGKLNFVEDMLTDKDLQISVDIIGGHVFNEVDPVSEENQQIAEQLGKPIWNTEDHVYKKGFDCLISIVECFNNNYINCGVTKIVNWYDIAALYPTEPYSEDPPMLLAYEPWSGHYSVRENLWGYAHYGQFSEVGWTYLHKGCRHLDGGGSMVTLQSADKKDYSIIIETKTAKALQLLTVDLHNMPNKKLCLWRSNEQEQFVRLDDIKTKGKSFTIQLEPNSVYSISTTRGQQKGSYAVPASKPFPFPYYDGFESYGNIEQWGCLPHYFADICGAFELTTSPDGHGTCIRQTVPQPTICWAPDWKHYTILGDDSWTDYEVSADVWLNSGDAAAVMGRMNDFGYGYGFIPKGYYLRLDDNGQCCLVVVRGKVDKKKLVGDAEQQAKIAAMNDDSEGGEKILASAHADGITPGQWHNLRLRFEGDGISGYVDGKRIVEATDGLYSHGMAGLLADVEKKRSSMPYFDNLKICAPNADISTPTAFDTTPIYSL